MQMLALVGPTASGKTEAAVELADRLDAEIVMVDSMALYRGMDVGTAKPTAEERARVRHHLLDVADPDEPFSVARFQSLATSAIADLRARGRAPLLVGGSGLYYRAVADDLSIPGTEPTTRRLLEAELVSLGPERMHRRLAALDPGAAGKIEPENARRTIRALEVIAITGRAFSSFAGDWERYPDDRVLAAGIEMDPGALRRRIEDRAAHMVAGGLIEESRALLARGFGGFVTASQAIGYLEAMQHLRGLMSLEEVVAAIVRRTKNLARRQLAWFRRDPRIRWFSVGSGGAIEALADLEDYLAQ